MTNLDIILNNRDITLPTKVWIVICISEVIDISPSNLDSSCASFSPAFLMMYYA